MTDRELLKQSLEALEKYNAAPTHYHGLIDHDDIIAALRERLSQQDQRPVAWMTINAYGQEDDIWYENPEGRLLDGWSYKPLYTNHTPKENDKVESVAVHQFRVKGCSDWYDGYPGGAGGAASRQTVDCIRH